MKRFTFDIFSKLSKQVESIRAGLTVQGIGFLRFDQGVVTSIYLVCHYANDIMPGFVKFIKTHGDGFMVNSFYHTISKILEVRYDVNHNVIAEYVNYKDGDKQVYLKLIDGVKADEYTIDKKEKKEFPEFRKEIAEYTESDTNEFSYFVKAGKETVYLQVK